MRIMLTNAGTVGARTVAAAAAATVAGAALTGCDLLSEAAPTPACGWLSTADAPEGAGRTVILMDRSGSTRGSGAPDYVGALTTSVESAVTANDVVFIGTFDGSASSVRWTAEALVTDRGRDNEENRREDEATARRCLLDKLTEAGADTAKVAGSDILGALGMGGQALRGVSGPKRIVLATDGLATTGCADLSDVPVGANTIIDRIGRLCRERAPQRNDLTGVSVTLLGVGHPAGGRPQPSTSQLDWLASLWSELCAEAANKPCAVSTAPVPTVERDEAAEPPDDPVLRFPPPENGVSGADGSTHFELDSEVLFAPNESVITAAGRNTLTDVATRIKQLDAAEVVVNGYTEAQASVAANRGLAQDRANAVRTFLTDRGVTVTAADGHGGTAPGCEPHERQCKRRVDIVAKAPVPTR